MTINNQPDREAKRDLISAIIEYALEDLRDWQPPTPRKGIGPAFPEVFREFHAALNALRADLQARLDQYGTEELRRDFPPSTTPRFNALFDRNGLHYDLADRLADLKERTPGTYVGGWAIAEKQIDLEHWRGHAEYRLKDACLLSVGRDPRFTNYDSVFESYGKSPQGDEVLGFLEDFCERIAGGFRLDPDDPGALVDAAEFFDWVKRHRVQIDLRFRRMLKEKFPQSSAPPELAQATASAAEPKLHGSTKTVLSRILLAVAMAKYGLDDGKKIGKVARAMQSDGDLNGLSFDSETVRKLLLSAWSELTDGQ